jgi:hypothetical protein
MRGGGFAGEAIQTTFAYAKCIIVCSSKFPRRCLSLRRHLIGQHCLLSINRYSGMNCIQENMPAFEYA